MNILIVDDDFFFQKAMSFFLNELDHTVHFAVNGEKAIERVKKEWFDLIICDLDMPVMHGDMFISEIANLFKNKRPVMVVVSGMKNGKERLNKGKIPYDHYFEKPLDVNVFGETLSKLGITKKK